MDPWLWTTVVIFVPDLIGLIIYLIVRNSYTKKSVQTVENL
ncbi:PLDc N-terminal domain-containing protein [Clostridium sp. FP1]|nr:PLDc N-terminal domain-containing protein [Clostridium sp. FP1]